MCPGGESNSHPFRDTILSRARLPIPPPGQVQISILENFLKSIFCLTNGIIFGIHMNEITHKQQLKNKLTMVTERKFEDIYEFISSLPNTTPGARKVLLWSFKKTNLLDDQVHVTLSAFTYPTNKPPKEGQRTHQEIFQNSLAKQTKELIEQHADAINEIIKSVDGDFLLSVRDYDTGENVAHPEIGIELWISKEKQDDRIPSIPANLVEIRKSSVNSN